MRVVITGADGFIGKNLQLHLAERKDVQVLCFTAADSADQLPAMLQDADFVFHLAGVNRARDPQDFVTGNVELTVSLCQALRGLAESSGRRIPVVYASSTQAIAENPYGHSKLQAEQALLAAQRGQRHFENVVGGRAVNTRDEANATRFVLEVAAVERAGKGTGGRK